jgi:histone H1/5
VKRSSNGTATATTTPKSTKSKSKAVTSATPTPKSKSKAVPSSATPKSTKSKGASSSEKPKSLATGTSETKSRRSSIGSAAGGGGSSKRTYQEYVHQAIVALADRTGSSLPAITKWILANYDHLGASNQFKTHLNQAIKQGIKTQHFAKIKASYKISPEWKAKERANKKKKVAAVKKQAIMAKMAKAAKDKAKVAKEKVPVTLAETKIHNAKKLKALQETMSVEDLEKAKLKMERAEQLAKERQEAERKAKERQEKLRRRRFPIEDTRLHSEDKELSVKPPADVIPRPYMPYFWHATLPLDHPARLGKTSSQVLTASKVDGLDFGNRGLVPDMLQIYHFFRGDVHYTGDDSDHSVVPEFTLKHLIHSVEQVLQGNSRRERLAPPLMSHLFCTCLQILCQGLNDDSDDSDSGLSAADLKLRKDLRKHLLPALSPASWGDVCFLYMDAMERYYTSDTTQENVLPSLTTDMEYLLGRKDQPVVPMTPGVANQNGSNGETAAAKELPAGYQGYLGDPRGVLFKAHAKLARQDPWQLTAEELLALLRALTDDCLATHAAISDDIAAREEEMHELSRNKRAVDMKFRKVRLAFEGPKKPAPRKIVVTEDKDKGEAAKEDASNGKQKDGDVENKNGNEKPKVEEPFKPTATKKQFEAAQKAQQKASDAYEKGIRKLVARTEPIGYDRDFNAIYCFRHDPEILYVEDLRPPSSAASHLPKEMQIDRRSWHVIETTSLFDEYASSLDIRGKRENDLYEEVLGPSGAQQSLRRYLYDDIKEQAAVNTRLKEKEALKERLENAKKKCDEESRRSGRLAGKAEEELQDIEREINGLEKKMSGESVPEPRDYDELTGLTLLRKFDSTGRMETRRTREKKETSGTKKLAMMPCSKLWGTGNIDGTGLPGMLVSAMLELEEHCNSLTPWEREDVTRAAWISRLEGAIHAWNDMSPSMLGSPDASRSVMNGDSASDAADITASDKKRRKLESPGGSTPGSTQLSISQIINILKQPLLDLEARVAETTNLAVATRDAELADDNMSTDGSEDDKVNQERLERAWKRIVNRIRNTPTKRYVQIREMLVDAITAARKAHLSDVVFKLRAALLQYHPSAAGQCKASAIKVLQEHGDYDEDDDDLEDEDDDEGNDEKVEAEKEEMPSVISAEAAILVSSLQGSDDATRADWIGAVKNCKTISRLAALSTAFVYNAKEKFEKIEVERDELANALAAWEKEEERLSKNRAGKKTTGKPPKEIVGPSEVWANVRMTDNVLMAKAEDYPWWPAKKCEPKNPALAKSLSNLNRSLVSLIGEMGGLRVVKNENLAPFTGNKIEEDDGETEVSKEIRSQLDDCMTMARRILRGRPNTASS